MNKLGTTVDHRSTQYKTIPLNDLTVGLLKKPGMAESITINGQSEHWGQVHESRDKSFVKLL